MHELSKAQMPKRQISPGAVVEAKIRTCKGISKEFVERGTRGVLELHYISIPNREERFNIRWPGERLICSHPRSEIRIVKHVPFKKV